MINLLKICQLFFIALGLVCLPGLTGVIAQEDPIDGKVFVGQSREKHKGAVEEDELRFLNGKFHSMRYGQRGFQEGAYKARTEKDKIYFEAETLNPRQGKIQWHGVVHENSIEVHYHWSQKGWFSNKEKDYSFNGTLKK